jgi:hypothetical protein
MALSQQDLQAFWAAAPQPKAPKKKGNLLTSLIPSAGGIGGSLGGAALGTAVLPGVGTLAGALLGGALGGGAGKVAENAVEGNKLSSGVAGEAALNGVLGAGPLRLGKFGYEAIKGGAAAAKGAERTFQAVEAAKGIPIKDISSVSKGTVGAKIPTSVSKAVKPLDDFSFVNRFKPAAVQAAKEVPGIFKTASRGGDPLTTVITHLAKNATKGETRTIVEKLFPVGLDNTGKNALVRNLQNATSPDQVKGLLSQADGVIRSQETGAIKPSSLRATFGDGQTTSQLMPAKQQATKIVETTAPQKTLADALVEAGNKATGMNAAKAVGDKLQKAGQGLIAKEFRLNPTQQADFRKVHGEEAVSVLRRYGIKKPEDVAAKIQPLQQTFDEAIGNIPAIDQKTLQVGLAEVYGPLIKSPILIKQNLGQSIKTQADELVKLAQSGNLPASQINDLRKEFDAAVRYTQKGAPEYNAVKETADALRTTLQSAADKAGIKTAEGTSLKDVGRELSKLYKLDSVVGKQSYLGSGSLPASLPNLLGAAAGGGVGGPVGGALGMAGTIALNSGVGRRAISNGALKAGERLSERGAASNPYGLKSVAGRVAPVGLADALINQSSGLKNTQPSMAMSENSNNQPSAANISPLNQTSSNLSSDSSPFAPQNLESAIQQILSNGGTIDDVGKFVSIAGAVQKAQATTQGTKKLNATQLQQANNAQSGLDSLATIQQTLQSNPNAAKLSSLPGGSFTQSLTGTGSYGAAINNATDVIGRLRSGGAINADEEKRFKALLPAAFDSPETVQYKLSALANLFNSFADPQSAQSDPTDLASAIMSAQGGY